MAEEKLDVTKVARGVVSFWGVLGVVAFLMNGFRRVLPVALEPLRSGQPLPPSLGFAYAGFGMFMAYVEGYRGFHLKFSPNVVARALTLTSPRAGVWSRIFAPLYCMELFGSAPGRVVSSWSFVSSIMLLVAAVKRLPPKTRAVVDGGVCTGMSIGILSLFYHYLNLVVFGVLPPIQLEHSKASGTISLCPVTLLSTTLSAVVKVFVGTLLGKEALERFQQRPIGKALMKCPISGKDGASEAECPMAKFMAGLGAPAPAPDASDGRTTAADESAAPVAN
mmetsp:Transcript_171005/g.547989  ORF Transcript_171005/g.547989 Transcript_171005/m.547989 type:complete len:279 (-) Transcript_171005:45-881(-)